MEMAVNGRDTEQYHHHLGLGLGLGLSLGMAGSTTTSPVEPAAPQRSPTGQQTCWNGAGFFFPASSAEQRTHADDQRLAALARHEMPSLRGIDVNRAPVAGEARGSWGASEEDEEPGACSPDSTLSSLSGKRGAPGRSGGGGGGGEQERSGAASDDEDDSGAAGGASRKKLRLSKDQSAVLEERFKEHSTLNPQKQKAALARQLGLRPRQVEVWFQNRRARTKLKQTEVDCESLKRCCETLTDENRRLQREVQELRALKLLAPPPPQHLYMRAPPPTTLTMCPSCGRVAPSGKPAVVESRAATLGTPPAPTGPWGPVPMMPMFVGRPAQRS